ncbi:MAG: glycosyltransferase family 4 protein [Candidatus Krumholzibacteria bacterium]|nr:glycosyltransferase family 4 protein [Candidatus Krumholzibacteria bacterium]
MKISFVEPHLEIYGGIRRIIELSNQLVRCGEDVTIYHPTGEPCAWLESKAKTRPTSVLLDHKHDVIIFNDPPDYKRVRRAKADLKVFYILCLYEREKLKRFNPKILWPKKGRMMSLRRALQMPFLRVANATWMQKYLNEELRMESLLLIGGINREMFYPVEVPKNGNEFRILCSGDPRERKGMDTIRHALDMVRASHPHVVLDTYHGKHLPQSEMAATYSSADLFVDAQWYAGWNNPVAEAMACRVPVVCTDIGGVADFAIHEETALLFPVDDVGGLARAIMRLIEDRALRERFKVNGYNKITQFTWDRSARRLLEILRARLPASISK